MGYWRFSLILRMNVPENMARTDPPRSMGTSIHVCFPEARVMAKPMPGGCITPSFAWRATAALVASATLIILGSTDVGIMVIMREVMPPMAFP
mmetsp:Transcript_27443/g.39774  ORF Transcript_27443/g.39774 Transcript_27443/m.39774 type:complete len:93 (-) Transcript_27443:1962-2240(-)